jgi:putative methyltransferase (TIGR04325 family)
MNITNLIKELCPPIVFRLFSRAWHYRSTLSFSGNYSSWEQAKLDSSGYDASNILEKIKHATLKVKNGEALFERDSVCFYHADNRYPALTCLLYIALRKNNQLNVLDFGGSLASFYFQHISILNSIAKLRWGVVEQPHFVSWGLEHLSSDSLKFYKTSTEFITEGSPDVIFLSSVLQYLQDPYQMLNQLLQLNAEYILLDRSSFINGSTDRLTVQTVPKSIYDAKYPAWFLSWEKFHQLITVAGYEIMMEFSGIDATDIGYYKGLLLQKKALP